MCSLKLFPSSLRALAALAATCRGRGAHARACRGPGSAERGAAQVPPLRRRRWGPGPLEGAPRVWGRLRFPVSGRIWGLSRHPVRRGRTRRPLPPCCGAAAGLAAAPGAGATDGGERSEQEEERGLLMGLERPDRKPGFSAAAVAEVDRFCRPRSVP